MNFPVILHIPHSSAIIPDEYLSDYTVPLHELAQENLKLVDLYTDEIYRLPGATRAVFPVSRFLVDAERFSDDTLESMAKRGMGALYTVGTNLQVIREVTPERRQELLDRYYWPHHTGLDQAALEMLDKYGECLVIDCHSYPSKVLPYEVNQTLPRPQIGIGTDEFHTPPELAAFMLEAFRKRGYEAELNVPFAGSLTPSAVYGKDNRVKSVMIEIRKDLYMDEATGKKTDNFQKLSRDIQDILGEAAWASLSPGNRALVV